MRENSPSLRGTRPCFKHRRTTPISESWGPASSLTGQISRTKDPYLAVLRAQTELRRASIASTSIAKRRRYPRTLSSLMKALTEASIQTSRLAHAQAHKQAFKRAPSSVAEVFTHARAQGSVRARLSMHVKRTQACTYQSKQACKPTSMATCAQSRTRKHVRKHSGTCVRTHSRKNAWRHASKHTSQQAREPACGTPPSIHASLQERTQAASTQASTKADS